MIAFHFNSADLETAASENQIGSWDFIIDDLMSPAAQQPKEKQFYSKGTWKEARAKAEVHARTCGSKDGVDSILVVGFCRSEEKAVK